jgi:hypothetical protein
MNISKKSFEIKFNRYTKNEFNEYITHMKSQGEVTEKTENFPKCVIVDYFVDGERFAYSIDEEGKENTYNIKE